MTWSPLYEFIAAYVGRFGGLQARQEAFFSLVQGDFVALHQRNE